MAEQSTNDVTTDWGMDPESSAIRPASGTSVPAAGTTTPAGRGSGVPFQDSIAPSGTDTQPAAAVVDQSAEPVDPPKPVEPPKMKATEANITALQAEVQRLTDEAIAWKAAVAFAANARGGLLIIDAASRQQLAGRDISLEDDPDRPGAVRYRVGPS